MISYDILQGFFDGEKIPYRECEHADGHKYLSCRAGIKNGPDYSIFIDIKGDETDLLVFDLLDLSSEEDKAPFYKMVCNESRKFRFANIFIDEDDNLCVCYSFVTPDSVSNEDYVALVWDRLMSVCNACDRIYMSYLKVKLGA